jgi:uroporphyrinogen decarboxylase
MERKEIVRKAIEFDNPERLPFWQSFYTDIPNDVCDCWEMDRQKNGWFFDPNDWPDRHKAYDDWGCGWAASEIENMGQVLHHPLQDWAKLDSYKPPNPKDPYYFERLEGEMADAEDRYVVVTSHFSLLERLEMLHGFADTLQDFYLEPRKCEKVLDMVLEWKIENLRELHRRFGDRVNGIFTTDDWGTQNAPYISNKMFTELFQKRYEKFVNEVHSMGWHFILHSCGKVNDLVPNFIDAGVDMLNMGQPQTYGIEELGNRFAGKIAFLTTVDIQKTLPEGNKTAIETETDDLIKNWATPKGGMVVFNYGMGGAIGVSDDITRFMFEKFNERKTYWQV